ncbi:MAG: hypothetical protein ACP59X_00150 [Solidesulfovibrio sp. DCME]|uniref:hypothetical protein n=1 Tax=Solidesulfovibrio sp. DCME TaxID=3447380 RepID=UPI003D116354
METRPRAGLMLFLGALVVAALLGGSVMRRPQTGLGAYGRVLAAARLAPVAGQRTGSDCLMRMVLLRQQEREASRRNVARDRGCATDGKGTQRMCAVADGPAWEQGAPAI